MRIQFKLNDQITLYPEGGNPAQLFESIADQSALFTAQTKCGCCQGPFKFQVRRGTSSSGNPWVFHELKCLTTVCGATFQFGSPRDEPGRLFPIYRDKDKQLLPNNGWSIYEGGRAAAPATPRQTAEPQRPDDEEVIPF